MAQGILQRIAGIYQYNHGGSLLAWDNIIYGFGGGIYERIHQSKELWSCTTTPSATVATRGIYLQGAGLGNYRVANNLVQGGTGADYTFSGFTPDYSATNLSSDATSPQVALRSKTVSFVGAADFHLSPVDVEAKNQGTDLSADPVLAVLNDIDGQVRQVAWDIGADDADGTTAVKLMSFEAVAADAAVELGWRTGSELDNLGFHVYRGLSEGGPWTRLTTSLIPGLGSSAVGRAYSFRDGGLVNGTRYFYRLEDVDASSKVTSHGPVSAVPLAGAAGGAPGSEPEASGGKKKGVSSQSCPDWVVAAYGSTAGGSASAAALRCTRHGDPEAVSLGVVSRDSRQATLELRTGGFYALHTCRVQARPRARCASSSRASIRRRTRRLRRCRSGGRWWTRSWGVGSSSAGCGRSIRWASAAWCPRRSARPRCRCLRMGRSAPAAGRFGSPRPSTCLWISRGCCRACSRERRRAPSSRSRRCATTRGAGRSCSRSGCW